MSIEDLIDAEMSAGKTTTAAEQPEEPNHESEAVTMGWSPKEKYRGDPDKWVDAKTFVDRGKTNMPMLHENLKRMETKFTATEKKNKDLEDQLKDMKSYQETMTKRAYDRALEDIEKKKRDAVIEGDALRYDALEKEKTKVHQDFSPKQVDKPTPKPEFDEDTMLTTSKWAAKNAWYDTNKGLRLQADIHFNRVEREHPSLTLQEKLEKVSERVRAENEELFPGTTSIDAAPARLPAVEGARTPARGRVVKGYGDLPEDAKEQCNYFVKKGTLTRDQYIKDYFGE